MISEDVLKQMDKTVREAWHYNDEGKAYTPETWEPLMEQFSFLKRTYWNSGRTYESLVRQYQEKKAGEQSKHELVADADGNGAALSEMEKFRALERSLVCVADPETIRVPLWNPGNIPDMRRMENFHMVCSDATATQSLDPEDYMPGFVPYLLEDGKEHPMILVLAGGHRANHTSGDPVCRFLNRIGCHAAVMGHRVGKQRLNFCLDLQRAVRTVRAHREEWHVREDQIGAIGFSFGGVVIVDYMEQMSYDDLPSRYDPLYRPDETDREDGALNAFLGIYTSSDPFMRRGEGLRYDQYPPTFLVCPGADPMVDVQISYLNDLMQHGVRTEAHLFDGGVHGFGLGDSKWRPNGADGHVPAIALWPELARLWLERIFNVN